MALKAAIKQWMPPAMRQSLQRYLTPAGRLARGSLSRLEPVSRKFGIDRGMPIDRYYIEQFLHAHRHDIRGRVLEVAEDKYTRAFGDERVTQSLILHTQPIDLPNAVVGDLVTGEGLEAGHYDCIMLTQVLPFIFDIQAAIQTCARCLKPGGVVLATVGGISQISRYDMDRWGDYWRLTNLSAAKLFQQAFADENVTVTTFGNVLSATAFLQGLSCGELTPRQLNHHDPDYQVTIGIRAVRGENQR